MSVVHMKHELIKYPLRDNLQKDIQNLIKILCHTIVLSSSKMRRFGVRGPWDVWPWSDDAWNQSFRECKVCESSYAKRSYVI